MKTLEMVMENDTINTDARSASNTFHALTNLPTVEANMAEKSLPDNQSIFNTLPTHRGFIDYTGERRGRLVVLSFAGMKRRAGAMWLCRCDCGNTKVVRAYVLATTGRSCGCIWQERMERKTAKTPSYRAFHGAKARCRNTRNTEYANYGGRGIEFRFTSFDEFIAEIGEKPSPQHSLDRIDNNGHYEPGNVKWSTLQEQSRNKRTNRYLTVDGVTLTHKDWALRLGIHHMAINRRVKAGWCERCTATMPKVFSGLGCPHSGRTGPLRDMSVRAYQVTWEDGACLVATVLPNQARRYGTLYGQSTGHRLRQDDVRVRRAPEFDEWARTQQEGECRAIAALYEEGK